MARYAAAYPLGGGHGPVDHLWSWRGEAYPREHADEHMLDLLVVGAGPTGIAIGAEARRAGL